MKLVFNSLESNEKNKTDSLIIQNLLNIYRNRRNLNNAISKKNIILQTINEDDYYYEQERDVFDFYDLVFAKNHHHDLILKLNSDNRNLNTSNLSSFNRNLSNLFAKTNETKFHHVFHVKEGIVFYDYELPVALIQLFILVLVLLIVLFLCKCNRIMEYLREKTQKQTQDLEEIDPYHDRKSLKDYFMLIWYNFKLRQRIKKRRRRRKFRNQEQLAGRKINSKGGGVRFGRKDSLIFKRRSAIYRNNRKFKKPDSAGSSSSINKRYRSSNAKYRNSSNSFGMSQSSPKNADNLLVDEFSFDENKNLTAHNEIL